MAQLIHKDVLSLRFQLPRRTHDQGYGEDKDSVVARVSISAQVAIRRGGGMGTITLGQLKEGARVRVKARGREVSSMKMMRRGVGRHPSHGDLESV